MDGVFISSTGGPSFARTREEQIHILENSKVISHLNTAQEWVMSNPITVDSWEDIPPTYLNTMVQALPDLAIQIGLSYIHPVAGMTYAGLLTGTEHWNTAEPYILEGKLSVQEATDLSFKVASASIIWNYGPSTLYNNAFRATAKKNLKKII